MLTVTRLRPATAVVGAILAVVLAAPPSARAQDDMPDRGCADGARVPSTVQWNTRSYTYFINNDSIPASGRQAVRQRQEARRQIVRGHLPWQRTSTECRRNGSRVRDQANFSFGYGGLTDRRYLQDRDENGDGRIEGPAEMDGWDGVNAIDFGGFENDPYCPPASTGCAPSRQIPIDHDANPSTPEVVRIVEADIRFDSQQPYWYRAGAFVDPRRCRPPEALTGPVSCADLYALTTHEVGHTIGLFHTCDADEQDTCNGPERSQTMNGVLFTRYRAEGFRFGQRPNHRTLGIADIRALRRNYPPR